ncbi:MAG: hypothetical protein IAE82_11745 [Opitutaceae bacterium]|nr:hypothetical protein [Opitutaceae bacterium]
MKKTRRPDGPSALDLIEEATHLVRCVPLSCGAAYAVGTVPFLLGATFFIADMSRGAHAALHLPGAALGLVVLFAWMKAWHAVAAEEALAHLEQREPVRPGPRAWLVLAARQFAFHGFGLALVPLATIAALPGGWVYAYYQNLTVLGIGSGERTHRAAWEQARLWPGQNHGALGALSLLGLAVLGNVAFAIYFVPSLVRTITGTERVFAQTGWNPLNTTFLAAVFALTFLAVDPVVKAFYVLRCFYGRSRRTGMDLLVQVRATLGRTTPVVVLGALLLVAAMRPLAAEDAATAETPGVESTTSGSPEGESTTPLPPPAVERTDALAPDDLNAAIERVLRDPEYVWREPPPRQAEGAASDFGAWVKRTLKGFQEWIRRIFRSDGDSEEIDVGRAGSFFSPGVILWLFVVAALVIVAMVAMAIIKRTETSPTVPAHAESARVPSLDREDLTADQLPEEEWMRLARELIARGEVRLGWRALFLGTLAGLAGRGLLVLARHKSNRDYERELQRRGAPLAAVVSAYAENRRAFEGVWYGDQRPEGAALARFEDNVRLLVRRDPA